MNKAYEQIKIDVYKEIDNQQNKFIQDLENILDQEKNADEKKIILVNGKFGVGKSKVLKKYKNDTDSNYIELFNYSFEKDKISFILSTLLNIDKKYSDIAIYAIIFIPIFTLLLLFVSTFFLTPVFYLEQVYYSLFFVITILIFLFIVKLIINKRKEVLFYFSKIKLMPSTLIYKSLLNIIKNNHDIVIFEDIDRLSEDDVDSIIKIVKDVSQLGITIILSADLEKLSSRSFETIEKIEPTTLFLTIDIRSSILDFLKVNTRNTKQDLNLINILLYILEINPKVRLNFSIRFLRKFDYWINSKGEYLFTKEKTSFDIILEFILEYFYGVKFTIKEGSYSDNRYLNNIKENILDRTETDIEYSYLLNSRSVFGEIFKRVIKKDENTNVNYDKSESMIKLLLDNILLSQKPIVLGDYIGKEIIKNDKVYSFTLKYSTEKYCVDTILNDALNIVNNVDVKNIGEYNKTSIFRVFYVYIILKLRRSKNPESFRKLSDAINKNKYSELVISNIIDKSSAKNFIKESINQLIFALNYITNRERASFKNEFFTNRGYIEISKDVYIDLHAMSTGYNIKRCIVRENKDKVLEHIDWENFISDFKDKKILNESNITDNQKFIKFLIWYKKLYDFEHHDGSKSEIHIILLLFRALHDFKDYEFSEFDYIVLDNLELLENKEVISDLTIKMKNDNVCSNLISAMFYKHAGWTIGE